MQKILIYVSPEGNDNNLGTINSPLKTIEKAKLIVREIFNGDIHIILRGGEYFLNKTVVFDIRDTGNAHKTITYENYENEEPILTSGVKITNFVKTNDIEFLPLEAKDRVFKAKFPENVDKILTLFNDTGAIERCHSDFVMPTKEYTYTQMDSMNVGKEEERYLLRRIDFENKLIKKRENMQDIELRFMPVPWTMNLLPIADVDEENGVATLAVEATDPIWAKPKGYRVENDISYLTKNGTWCSNSLKRELYYIPKNNVVEENLYIPTLKEYFRIEGVINYDNPKDFLTQNLHFKGLTFVHGMRDTTQDGYKGLGIQHDWEMFDKGNALLRFRGAKNCSVKNCYFYNTSATAIRLDLSCQNIEIQNNMLDNIGNMGILLCGYGPGTKNENHHNDVSNNIITRCGEEIWHGHAIFLWQSGDNLISHNKIHDCARKAIGLCGVRITILQRPDHKFDEASRTIRWNEIQQTMIDSNDEYEKYLPYLHCRNNKVIYNDCYQVLQKMGDGSAINISGAGDNNLIKYNYVHHISTYNASAAIRFDDWQCGTTVESNIIYMCNLIGITRKNHNDIINNFIIDVSCTSGYLRFASYPNEKPNFGAKIEKNIFMDTGNQMVIFSKGYLMSESGACLPENCNINSNIYWCAKNMFVCEKHIAEMKNLNAKLEDKSIIDDPLFNNLDNEDFSFNENSPAYNLGIQPIDRTKIGVTKNYPKNLLEKEYINKSHEVYERGKNPEKQNYNWW